MGLASWYGARFHKRRTASGELFDMKALTAAHPTLPFGSLVCVRSQITGRSVVVRNNDREQTHWSNASLLLTKLTFEHLSAGSYSLELRLFDPGTGRYSEPEITTFKVKASWYEETVVWFIAGILVGFFGLLYLKRRKRLKKLELNKE